MRHRANLLVLDGEIERRTAELTSASGPGPDLPTERDPLVADVAHAADEDDPEEALRAANAKFTRRFGAVEAALSAEGRRPQDSSLAEMDALWDAAKAAEKAGRVERT